jgi:hypothetical protein
MSTVTTESRLNVLLDIDDTDIPDYIHMRTLSLARLLDDIDSLDDVKFVLMAQVMELSRSVSLLETRLLDIEQTLTTTKVGG